MRWYAVGVALFLGLGAGAVAGALSSGPSVEELTADIRQIDREIVEAEMDLNEFKSGSLLFTLAQTRLQTLKTTKSMLDQKRRAWIRGITMTFTREGRPIAPADPKLLQAIDEDIRQAEADVSAASARANQYTGGLIKLTALLEEQTARSRVVIEKQRRAIARIGYALPDLSAAAKPSPVGNVLSDDGAL